jgi:hypothetical protein
MTVTYLFPVSNADVLEIKVSAVKITLLLVDSGHNIRGINLMFPQDECV